MRTIQASAISSILLAGACSAPAPPPPPMVGIVITDTNGDCAAEVEGQTYRVPGDAEGLTAHFRRMKREGKLARLANATPDTPWLCVGPIFLCGQDAGLAIGFTAEPPPDGIRNEG